MDPFIYKSNRYKFIEGSDQFISSLIKFGEILQGSLRASMLLSAVANPEM